MFSLTTAAAAPGTGPMAAEESRLDEPLPVRNQLPLGLPFLELAPRSAFLPRGGTAIWSLRLSYENTCVASESMVDLYRQDDFATYDGLVTRPILEGVAAGSPSGNAYYVDGETLRAVIEGRLGLSEKVEAGLEIPLLMHTTGFMDASIDSFHARWDLPDGGRTAFAQHQYVTGYSDAGRTVFLGDSPAGLRIGDLVLSGRAALAGSGTGRSALAISLEAKIPTGSVERIDGSGHADFGAGLQASWRLGRTSLHAGYGYSRPGGWSLEPALDLGDRQSLFFTWAFRATPTSGLLVQVLGGSGPFPRRSDGTLGEPAAELAIGMRHAGVSPWSVEWALLENLTQDLNVPDVGLFFGVSRRSTWRKGGQIGP